MLLVSIILVHPLHFKLYLSECIGLVVNVNEIPPFKIQSDKFHFHSLHYSGSSLSGRSSVGDLSKAVNYAS